MLYEPLPGSAAVILVQLGIIEEGQIEALGQRTYDAESGRLSLALDDGRTVELERAMHLQSEDGYAVRIRSRAGQTISRSFIHIDRNLAVRNLHNDRMVYIDDLDEPEYDTAPDFSSLETAEPETAVSETAEPQTAEEFPAAPSIDAATDEGTPAEDLHAWPAEHQEPHTEPVYSEPASQTSLLKTVECIEAHVGNAYTEPQPEALYGVPDEAEETEVQALHIEPEAAHDDLEAVPAETHTEAHPEHSLLEREPLAAEPQFDILQAEPEIERETIDAPVALESEIAVTEPLQDQASTESDLLQPEPESELEVAGSPEASEPLDEPLAYELQAAPELNVDSKPELHIEAVLAAEGSIEPAFEPSVEPEIHGEAVLGSQTSAQAAAPVAELELPSIDTPESQAVVGAIAAEPEASAVTVPEPEIPESISSNAVGDEISLDPQPGPEELQPAEAIPALDLVDPLYIPLYESLTPEDAALFEFIAQTGTVHTYEHRETYRYIHIDAPSGLFYDQTRTPISRAAALKHALTPRIPIATPTPEPEPEPTPISSQAASASTPPPPLVPTLPVTDFELRTRSHSLTNGHARAAVKLDPVLDPDPTTPPPDTGLSLDAFTRKRAQLERDSWRARLSEISRALRGNRTPTDDN